MVVSVPYIPPSKSLPEITLKGVILAIFLSVILGGANVYLGLKVGLTVSASIPAAVISMAMLGLISKLGKKRGIGHNILENNAVQTAASAGESLAAGVLFTIPALLLLNYWADVHYWETTIIALLGGILGVLFTVPLRRALIVEAELLFPEGVATSEVLKAGEPIPDAKQGTGAVADAQLQLAQTARVGIIALISGAAAGFIFKAMQSGLRMWTETALFARRIGDKGVVAFGSDLSPALLGVGYIVGLRIASLVFLGGVIGWLVAIPIFSVIASDSVVPHPNGPIDWVTDIFDAGGGAGDVAGLIWSTQIRYMGVGAMLIGGLWALVKLRKPLGQALTAGFRATSGGEQKVAVIRTEREFGTRATFLAVLGMVVPIFALYWYVTGSFLVGLVMAGLMVITGFLFSAVGAYMAGLVGSSNNPISGVTILTVLASAFTLKFMGVDSTLGPAATIMVAAVIACAGAIASDNMQDLKAGYILGSTPKRQQTMQVIGVAAAAFAMAPVLRILNDAYTLGSPAMSAPQASLMAAVAGFVFDGGLPAGFVAIGAAIAVTLIVMDEILEKMASRFRTPVMPVAVGIYLPVGLSVPIFLGGVLAWALDRRYRLEGEQDKDGRGLPWWTATRELGGRAGVLFASGLIAGEAFLGILLAVALSTIGVDRGGETVLAIAFHSEAVRWTGLIAFGYLIVLMWYFVRRPAITAKPA